MLTPTYIGIGTERDSTLYLEINDPIFFNHNTAT